MVHVRGNTYLGPYINDGEKMGDFYNIIEISVTERSNLWEEAGPPLADALPP